MLRSSTLSQIRRAEVQSAQRTEAQTKMSSDLLDAAHPLTGLPGLRSAPLETRGGKTLVDIEAEEVDDALFAAITQAGGTVVNAHPEYRAVRAYVPIDRMEGLAASRKVRFITPAVPFVTQAMPVAREGVVAHLADRARALFNVDGSGIKVGILSNSIDNGNGALAGAYQTGAIDPSHLQVLPGQDGTGNAEGLAMAEIVHALAPGASVHFATAIGGEAQMAANIRALQEVGCTIIIDDVGYADEPPFQDDGPVSRAVSYVTARGVLYFSSAGNSGNKKQNTSSAWEGDFVDGGQIPDLPGEQHVHIYAPQKDANLVAAGKSQWAGLFWADPRHGSQNQYNLYVIDAKGELKRRGTTSHTGFQPPWQLVDGVEAGDAVVITKNADAKPLYLRLETPRAALTFATQGNTSGHGANDSNMVFSVAAVTALDPPEPFTGGLARPVARYSSDGPRRKFFNPDGSPITPGDLLSEGGRSSAKPDIAAAARVNTSVPGFQPFQGTSAAAPHAGAVAALLWSYDRSLTADQVSSILRRTALPIDGGPEGGTAGAGVVTAVPALRLACQQGARLVCPDGSEAVMTSGKPAPVTSSSGSDAETATQMLLK